MGERSGCLGDVLVGVVRVEAETTALRHKFLVGEERVDLCSQREIKFRISNY